MCIGAGILDSVEELVFFTLNRSWYLDSAKSPGILDSAEGAGILDSAEGAGILDSAELVFLIAKRGSL